MDVEHTKLTVEGLFLYITNTSSMYGRACQLAKNSGEPLRWLGFVAEGVTQWRREFKDNEEDKLAQLPLEQWGILAAQLREYYLEHVNEG